MVRWTICVASRSRNSISTSHSREAICCTSLSSSTERASPGRSTDASIPTSTTGSKRAKNSPARSAISAPTRRTARPSWTICFWSRRVGEAICNFCWRGRFIPMAGAGRKTSGASNTLLLDDHPALYSSSRATLNITRQEMAASGYCPSGRFFEAAACGTPILTDDWEGLDAFFDPERELHVVRTPEDVLTCLDMPAAELREPARAGASTHAGRAHGRAPCDGIPGALP